MTLTRDDIGPHPTRRDTSPRAAPASPRGPSHPRRTGRSDELVALRAQCARYETALAKIVQGVCFFDKDRHLIVSNRRWAEIYRLDPDQVVPGTTLHDIARHRHAAGTCPAMTCEDYVAWCDQVNLASEPHTWTAELQDGRTIYVYHHPMPDGGWVATHEDITDRRRAEAKIEHMAHHDALTDLPNRALFLDRLSQAMGRATATRKPWALLFLDLDHFKEVNDSFGHMVGDGLLREAVQRIKAHIREADTLARLGGDEFAMILSDIPGPEVAASTAQRIVDAFAAPFVVEGQAVEVGVSVGIKICYPGEEPNSPDQILREADTALYQAKKEGRSTFCFFERSVDTLLKRRHALKLELRRAVDERQFEIHYQPKMGPGLQVCGAEALVRWRHPERGLVAPGGFIALAEETGLILPIGERVLRTACAQAVGWPALKIAVNVSAMQIRGEGFPALVESILRQTGLPPDRLELEIVESTLLQDTESVIATLHELKSMGVSLAMDDFGTGYSSLNYLRLFPFDRLKIDRTFVQDMNVTASGKALVKATIAMGHALGIETTAEGVETTDQVSALLRQGCDELQGFFFARAMPAPEFERYLGAVATRPLAANA